MRTFFIVKKLFIILLLYIEQTVKIW